MKCTCCGNPYIAEAAAVAAGTFTPEVARAISIRWMEKWARSCPEHGPCAPKK